MPLPDSGESSPPDHWITLPPPYASREFSRFLADHRVTVLDVVPGAAWGHRRLLVGEPQTGVVRYATAVGQPAVGFDPIAREELVLTQMRPQLHGSLRETVPEVVQRVDVFTNLNGLVVTGVPGLRPSGLRPAPPPMRDMLLAMDAWLTAVWQQTAGERAPVDLGAGAIDVLLGRYAGTTQLEPALELLRSTRLRLAEFEVVSTLSHGCLCLRHAMFEGTEVVGVDDWGLATPSGGPLRDVAAFAVRASGSRLPEVITGESPYAGLLRQFVTSGLARLDLPRKLWRHVLLLAQLELAIAALERDDHDGMVLLARAVGAVPRKRI
jgi:hypothetical protein